MALQTGKALERSTARNNFCTHLLLRLLKAGSRSLGDWYSRLYSTLVTRKEETLLGQRDSSSWSQESWECLELGWGLLQAFNSVTATPPSLKESHLCPPGSVESPVQLLPKYSPCSTVAIALVFNMKNGCGLSGHSWRGRMSQETL